MDVDEARALMRKNFYEIMKNDESMILEGFCLHYEGGHVFITAWAYDVNKEHHSVDLAAPLEEISTAEDTHEYFKNLIGQCNEEIHRIKNSEFESAKSKLNTEDLHNLLPSMGENVFHPIQKCKDRLSKIIVSLNDHYKWSREQIADWLDTLDIDLTFKD